MAEAAKKPAKAKTAKAAAGGKKVRVTQIGSSIGRPDDQLGTLIGLGLGKRHRVRELEDTPSVCGMIINVRSLRSVEDVG